MAEKPRQQKNVICPQGKTFRRTIIGKTENGDIWDLTGWTARVEIRTYLPNNIASEVLIRLSTEDSGLTIDTVNNESRILMEIDADTTASFPVGNYIWELEIEDTNGFVPYLMAPSRFKVLAENTL